MPIQYKYKFGSSTNVKLLFVILFIVSFFIFLNISIHPVHAAWSTCVSCNSDNDCKGMSEAEGDYCYYDPYCASYLCGMSCYQSYSKCCGFGNVDWGKPSCEDRCIKLPGHPWWWESGGVAICTSDRGWDCDYSAHDVCLPKGCCDATCDPATGCGTKPNDARCNDYNPSTKDWCDSNCECHHIYSCSDYTTQSSCEDAGCKWCAKCSGRRVNKWRADKCVDPGTNCEYTCKIGYCGAECEMGIHYEGCAPGEYCGVDCLCHLNPPTSSSTTSSTTTTTPGGGGGGWDPAACKRACQAQGYPGGTCKQHLCNPGQKMIGHCYGLESWVCCCYEKTTTTTIPPSRPDLVITKVWFGSDRKVHYTIKNQGNANAGYSYSKLYASIKQTPTIPEKPGKPSSIKVTSTLSTSVTETDYVPSLPAGSSSNESFSGWTCDPGKVYMIRVCADAYDQVSESNETNNCRDEILSCSGKNFCGNGICEAGETQENCKSDCKTEIKVYGKYPDKFEPGEKVKVIVSFNDSRFNFSFPKKVSFKLTFDYGKANAREWVECFRSVVFSVEKGTNRCHCNLDKCECRTNFKHGSGKCGKWEYAGETKIVAKDNYFTIEAYCDLPEDITLGIHTLRAVPTLHSEVIVLRPGETSFYLKASNPIEAFISFLNRLFGMFRLGK